MRYVILRDDDTNALTPPARLERLYRPFLDRGLPVNLSVIPEVRTDVRLPDGRVEGFLMARTGDEPETLPMSASPGLLSYLSANDGYKVVQHGCYHDYMEFERKDRREVARRVEHGAQRLQEAGLGRPRSFVAPYDQISKESLSVVAQKFDVVSTGWFELGKVPCAWWPQYAMKKLRQRAHWRAGSARLLSHPGCLLSYQRPVSSMMDEIRDVIASQQVTVLVTHWWEYFIDNKEDGPYIDVLHETADYLANNKGIRVVSFDDVAAGRVPLN